MVSACGRYVLVLNGEIYNHLDLRSRLEAQEQAPAWRGHSDTETILAALAAWGIQDTLKAAVGMFAMALWDRQERELTLMRDRMGEKPRSEEHRSELPYTQRISNVVVCQ